MGNSSSSDEEVSSGEDETCKKCDHDRYKLKPIKSSQLKRGDQIAVLRNIGPVDLYYHHAIYVGGDEPMVGFGGLDWEGTTKVGFGTALLRQKVDDFRQGDDELFRVVWPKGVAKKPKQVAFTAETFLNAYEKDPSVFGEYDSTENNCEHFASYCKTGFKISQQVEDLHFYIMDFFSFDTDEEKCKEMKPAEVAEKFVARRKVIRAKPPQN